MSTGNSSLISAGFSQGIDHFGSFHRKALILVSKPSRTTTELPSLMWRNSAKQAVCRARACCFTPQSSSRGFSRRCFLGKVAEHNFHSEAKPRPFELAFGLRSPGEEDGRLGNRIRFGSAFCAKAYASVAEAVSSPTDVEEDGPFAEELLQEVRKEEEEKCEARLGGLRRPRVFGMSKNKYGVLRKRQVRAETEAWEKATKEYRELLREMCRQKLAPNLPYMKSLFLGWFEPFRDAIEKEQEMCRKRKNAALAPFLLQLPAEMMAVITMHKLVGLLMSREEHGTTRVVAAALMVGEAVEQEV